MRRLFLRLHGLDRVAFFFIVSVGMIVQALLLCYCYHSLM